MLSHSSERLAVTVGGFDQGPCELCARDEPCLCGPGPCACICGRCQYPFPLADDGPCYRKDHR